MTPYTRPQLWLLLGLTALGGLGVLSGGWRRVHPDLTERLDLFDAAYPIESAVPRSPDPRNEETAAPRAESALATHPPSPSRPSVEPLHLNRATAQDLERLPGIGPALAERIVATREQSGSFASVDDLRRVPGLGRGKLARVRDLLTVTD